MFQITVRRGGAYILLAAPFDRTSPFISIRSDYQNLGENSCYQLHLSQTIGYKITITFLLLPLEILLHCLGKFVVDKDLASDNGHAGSAGDSSLEALG